MDKVGLLGEIIKGRRAIFPPMYTGERVADSVIWQILENANWAPTHRQTEPWRFKVIPQEKIPKLCAFGAEWYTKFTPPDLFSEFKLNKIKTKALPSSHVIGICMKRDAKKRLPRWEEEAAVACAVQNMWLTCTALGLGCYWSTPGYALNGNEFFELKKKERCLGLFYIGVPKENLKLSVERNDIKEKVTWL